MLIIVITIKTDAISIMTTKSHLVVALLLKFTTLHVFITNHIENIANLINII